MILPMTRVMLSDEEGVAIYAPSPHITIRELAEIVQLFGVHCSPSNVKRDWRTFLKEKEIIRNFVLKTHAEHEASK